MRLFTLLRSWGIDFLLMKLDAIKAFDCLEWEFIIELLHKIGFSPKFIKLVEAINAIAASAVLLQGKLGEAFQLKRSVRQGCPLSPLIFLLATNALSWSLAHAETTEMIRGVLISVTCEFVTHAQYVDDTSVIIEAKP